MGAIASQINSLTIVYSTVYSDADQRKHQISTSLAFVWGIHRGPVNCPHKRPVTRNMFPFDNVIVHIRASIQWAVRLHAAKYRDVSNLRDWVIHFRMVLIFGRHPHNTTCASVALMSRRLSNNAANRNSKPVLRCFTGFGGKTSYRRWTGPQV